ncbi:MAG TPA: hypothetical protein VEY30_10125, partial [Myxococcaceae bacterium]|nr:hypothetical protein [Myxococcaceae bacterium]
RGALAGVLLATGVVLLFWGWVHPWELALVQVGAWLMGWGVSAWDPIERRLVGRKVLAEAARARAVRAFHEHNLHRTAAGTGVLIFASLFEHEVVVLGDRGIDAQMGPEGWKHAVDALVRALRASRPAEGFVEAIAQCGEVLARHFPRAGGTGPNELDDRLRMDKSL